MFLWANIPRLFGSGWSEHTMWECFFVEFKDGLIWLNMEFIEYKIIVWMCKEIYLIISDNICLLDLKSLQLFRFTWNTKNSDKCANSEVCCLSLLYILTAFIKEETLVIKMHFLHQFRQSKTSTFARLWHGQRAAPRRRYRHDMRIIAHSLCANTSHQHAAKSPPPTNNQLYAVIFHWHSTVAVWNSRIVVPHIIHTCIFTIQHMRRIHLRPQMKSITMCARTCNGRFWR